MGAAERFAAEAAVAIRWRTTVLLCDRCQKSWHLPAGQNVLCPACQAPLRQGGPAQSSPGPRPMPVGPSVRLVACPNCSLEFQVHHTSRGAQCPQCHTGFAVNRASVLWIVVLILCGLALAMALFASFADRPGGLGPVTAPAWLGAFVAMLYVVARAIERLLGR